MNDKTICLIYLFGQKKMDIYLDKIYDSCKTLAYKKMKNSKYRKLQFVRMANIERTIQYNKAIGVMEYFYELEVNHLNTKKYKELSQMVTNAVIAVYNDLIQVIIEKDEIKYKKYLRKIANNHTDDFLSECMIVTFIIDFEFYQKTSVTNDADIDFMEYMLNLWTYNGAVDPNLYKNDQITSMRKKYFPQKDLRLLSFFHSFQYKDELFHKYTMGIEFVATHMNLDYYSMGENLLLTKSDFNMICYSAVRYGIQEECLLYYLWTAFVIAVLAKQFNSDKELFFHNNDEIIKLENKVDKINEKEYKKIIKELEEKNEGLVKILEEKDREIERIRKEYRGSLEKELKNKESDIEYLESLLQEKLEEQNQKSDQKEININQQEICIQELKPFIIEDTIYIAGGYPTLIQKLTKYFPNMIHISDSTTDIQRYKDKEIFLLTQFIPHKTRFLFESLKNIKFEFINKIGINQIADDIKRILLSKN